MKPSAIQPHNTTTQRPEPHNDSTAIIQVIERAALNPEVDIEKME